MHTGGGAVLGGGAAEIGNGEQRGHGRTYSRSPPPAKPSSRAGSRRASKPAPPGKQEQQRGQPGQGGLQPARGPLPHAQDRRRAAERQAGEHPEKMGGVVRLRIADPKIAEQARVRPRAAAEIRGTGLAGAPARARSIAPPPASRARRTPPSMRRSRDGPAGPQAFKAVPAAPVRRMSIQVHPAPKMGRRNPAQIRPGGEIGAEMAEIRMQGKRREGAPPFPVEDGRGYPLCRGPPAWARVSSAPERSPP